MTESQNIKKFDRKAPCGQCGRARGSKNPLAKCWECEKDFCYPHILSGQINASMGINETIRDVCSKCQVEFNYRDLT